MNQKYLVISGVIALAFVLPFGFSSIRTVRGAETAAYIRDHESLIIEDRSYALTTEIIANESSVIIVRNATLMVSPDYGINASIVLEQNAHLLIVDSTIVFNKTSDYCNIEAWGQTEINVANSKMSGKGLFIGHDISTISVNGVIFKSTSPVERPSGFVLFGNSSLTASNSTIDGAFIWDNGTASIDNSEISLIRSGYDQLTNAAIYVNNSRILDIDTLIGKENFLLYNSYVEVGRFHGDISAFLGNCTVGIIYGSGNASIWLDNSRVNGVSLEKGARVLVAIYFPIIGLIGIPYELTGFLSILSLLAVIAGTIAVFSAVYRRQRS